MVVVVVFSFFFFFFFKTTGASVPGERAGGERFECVWTNRWCEGFALFFFPERDDDDEEEEEDEGHM